MKKGLMTERRPCMLSVKHGGYHSPDLMGMRFHNLKVVAVGTPRVRRIGSPLFTWTCRSLAGHVHPNIEVHALLFGKSQGRHVPYGLGYLNAGGYRKIRYDGRQMLEHRVVMSKILGRALRSDEHVHHGPKGRACNDPDNLSIRLVGKHPQGHSVEELADWLRGLGCIVEIPTHLLDWSVS